MCEITLRNAKSSAEVTLVKLLCCWVPGCSTGYWHSKGGHFFIPPTDKLEFQKWARAVPRIDKDLTRNIRICDTQFAENFFINNETV
ncbi:hypothetical protein C0J52_07594 [Blattella germanica]|nr:hypothetical protein C0J52_07594 [Blattella germanica]